MSQTRERTYEPGYLVSLVNSTKWLGFTTMQDASRAPLQRVGARERCERPAVVWMAENGWYMPALALL